MSKTRPGASSSCTGTTSGSWSERASTPLSEAAWARLRRRRVGYVFQFFNLIDNLTAANNIELPARVAGHSASDTRTRRVALMEALGIADAADQTPGRLSGGQQQRVAIARALVNDPELLLADEPTGNLDSATSADVMSLFEERHRAGQTIVMVTHDDRIAARADRVVRMRDGVITGETRLAEGSDMRSRVSELVEVGFER